jgi:hypothetical protein
MKDKFSRMLCLALVRHYGRMPSAAVVARDFNLRCTQDVKPITNETSRRWIKGISLPELARLNVLANWINLDIGNLQKLDGPNILTDSNLGKSDKREVEMLALFRKLDLRDRKMIQGLIETLANKN